MTGFHGDDAEVVIAAKVVTAAKAARLHSRRRRAFAPWSSLPRFRGDDVEVVVAAKVVIAAEAAKLHSRRRGASATLSAPPRSRFPGLASPVSLPRSRSAPPLTACGGRR